MSDLRTLVQDIHVPDNGYLLLADHFQTVKITSTRMVYRHRRGKYLFRLRQEGRAHLLVVVIEEMAS